MAWGDIGDFLKRLVRGVGGQRQAPRLPPPIPSTPPFNPDAPVLQRPRPRLDQTQPSMPLLERPRQLFPLSEDYSQPSPAGQSQAAAMGRPRQVLPMDTLPPPIRPEEQMPLPAIDLYRKLPRAPERREYEPGAEGLSEYERDLETYEPENHNSRLRSVLLGLGRGALTGLASGGSLGSALGGALAGGAMHGIDPSMDEWMHRDAELRRVQGRLDEEQKRRKAGLETKKLEADIALTGANAIKALRPPETEYGTYEGKDGFYAYPKSDPSKIFKLPVTPKGRPITPHWAGNKWRYIDDDGTARDITDAQGNPITDPEKAPVMVNGFWTTQGEAAKATAKAGEAKYEDEVKGREGEYADKLKSWEEAKGAGAELRKLREEVDKAKLEAANPKDPQEAKYWQGQAALLEERLKKRSAEVSATYGEYLDHDEYGWPTLPKPRPTKPPPPPRPEPVIQRPESKAKGVKNKADVEAYRAAYKKRFNKEISYEQAKQAISRDYDVRD